MMCSTPAHALSCTVVMCLSSNEYVHTVKSVSHTHEISQEAREWESLINSTQQLQQDVQRALADTTAQPSEEDLPTEGPCAGQLRAAQEALQQALTVQAEGLCAAVDKSRALLEGAEHCCHEIQVLLVVDVAWCRIIQSVKCIYHVALCAVSVIQFCVVIVVVVFLVVMCVATTPSVQNKYHHEKFKPFSDMDAPAALIKKLTANP